MPAYKSHILTLALIASVAIIFASAWSFANFDQAKKFSQQLDSVNEQGEKLSTALQTQLAVRSSMAQSLAAMAEMHPDMTNIEFATLAARIRQEREDIINIAYAPDLIVRHVYPHENNTAALGLDYRTSPKFAAGVDLALERNRALLVGPIKLIQGGSGLILRQPVNAVSGDGASTKNIMSLVLDVDKLTAAAGVGEASELLNVAAYNGAMGEQPDNMIIGSRADCGPDAVRRQLFMLGSPWTLCLTPKAGWAAHSENAGLIWAMAIVVAIATTGVFLFINHLRIGEANAKRQLWNAIEALNIGFVLYDANDKMSFCNSRYLEMYKDNADGIRPGNPFRTTLEKAVSKGQIPSAIGRECEWIEGRLAAHLSPQGEFEQNLSNGYALKVFERKTLDGGIVGFHVDVTDLKRAQSDAEASKVATGEFLNNINHEIRTPLSVIVGFIGFLANPRLQKTFKALTAAIENDNSSRSEIREAADDFADQLKFQAERVQKSSTHLLNLVQETLDLSQAQSGALSFHPADVALTPLVDDVLHQVKHQADTKGLSLKSSLSPVELHVDPNRLRQILTHVIGNAVKFTSSGSVAISNKIEAEWTEIIVKDTGPGIEKQHREKVFEAFWQADGSDTRDHNGTGLGLAYCRKLVDLHGGSFWLDEEETTGSTFHIRLPRAKPKSLGSGEAAEKLAG